MTYIDPHKKLFGHLDRIAELGKGQNPPPVNVEIDLSNRCSLGCRDCHFAYTHTRGPLAGSEKPNQYLDTGDLMDVDLALSIIRQLKECGVRSITWSGGGEPTLHHYFDDIVTRVEIDQGIYTHGGHITERLARILKRHFKWVYVSLDCVDAESYAKYKQVSPDRFDDACQGIRYLVEADGPATIGVGFLLNKDNCEDSFGILDMVDLGHRLGADYIQFRPTILYDYNMPSKLVEDTNWIGDIISDPLLWAKREYPDIEIDISRFEMYQNWRGHGYQTCWWSGLQTVISPNGKVWGCVNKRGVEEALLGDLRNDTFAEIWDNTPLQKVNDQCRIMCRGHIPNLSLDKMFEERKHVNFI